MADGCGLHERHVRERRAAGAAAAAHARRRDPDRRHRPQVRRMSLGRPAALTDTRRTLGHHVGDSRAYLIRDGELVQLTDDHSLVGELVRSGKLAPEDADSHPQRSVITRALGTDPDVDVDTATVETRAGDLFLLCSDGLYSMVGNDRIL